MKLLMPSYLVLVVFFSISCGGEKQSSNSALSEIPITRKSVQSEMIRTVANLSIDGMTCAAGCGGKIQQELRNMQGVEDTQLDFVENRPVNTVTVQFNPAMIDEKKMIDKIASLNDGQYHVKAVEIIEYKGLQSHGSSSGADVQEHNFGQIFKILNLLEAVIRLVE